MEPGVAPPTPSINLTPNLLPDYIGLKTFSMEYHYADLSLSNVSSNSSNITTAGFIFFKCPICPMNPGDLDSSWSTWTHGPGKVAILEGLEVLPLVCQDFLMLLPEMQLGQGSIAGCKLSWELAKGCHGAYANLDNITQALMPVG